ncbi:hypothetical protein ACHAXN_005045 [Cyclotella atomus]
MLKNSVGLIQAIPLRWINGAVVHSVLGDIQGEEIYFVAFFRAKWCCAKVILAISRQVRIGSADV